MFECDSAPCLSHVRACTDMQPIINATGRNTAFRVVTQQLFSGGKASGLIRSQKNKTNKWVGHKLSQLCFCCWQLWCHLIYCADWPPSICSFVYLFRFLPVCPRQNETETRAEEFVLSWTIITLLWHSCSWRWWINIHLESFPGCYLVIILNLPNWEKIKTFGWTQHLCRVTVKEEENLQILG